MCQLFIFLSFCFYFPPLTFCRPVLHGLSDWNGDWDAPKIWGFIQSEKLAAQQPCKLLFYKCFPYLYLDFCLTRSLAVPPQPFINLSLIWSLLFSVASLNCYYFFKFTACYRNALRSRDAAASRLQSEVLANTLRGPLCDSRVKQHVFPCSSSGCWTIMRQQRA